jgi:hypothetical protein
VILGKALDANERVIEPSQQAGKTAIIPSRTKRTPVVSL